MDVFGDLAFIVIVGGVFFYKAREQYNKSAQVKNTAKEKIRSVALGRTELKGKARENTQNYDKPFTDGECLYSIWKIERKSRDNESGKWTTISSGTVGSPFLLDDGTGKIIVDINDGEPDWEFSEETKDQFRDGLLRRTLYKSGRYPEFNEDRIKEFAEDNDIELGSSEKRYTQKYIEEGDEVYVLGETKQIEDVSDNADITKSSDRLKIGQDENSGKFIISDKDEQTLSKSFRRKALMYTIGGFIVVMYGIMRMILF